VRSSFFWSSILGAATRVVVVTFALLGVVAMAPAPAEAAGFQLFGSYFEPDLDGETVGIGFGYGFRIARPLDIDIRVTFFDTADSASLQGLWEMIDLPELDAGIDIHPIDIGLRYNFTPGNPAGTVYVGAGVSYYLLEAVQDVDDEVGLYAMVGAVFGGRSGPAFFVEGMYRVADDANIDSRDIPGLEGFDGIDFGLDGPQVSFGIVLRKR
jgi:hypothetical protein